MYTHAYLHTLVDWKETVLDSSLYYVINGESIANAVEEFWRQPPSPVSIFTAEPLSPLRFGSIGYVPCTAISGFLS